MAAAALSIVVITAILRIPGLSNSASLTFGVWHVVSVLVALGVLGAIWLDTETPSLPD